MPSSDAVLVDVEHVELTRVLLDCWFSNETCIAGSEPEEESS